MEKNLFRNIMVERLRGSATEECYLVLAGDGYFMQRYL